MAERYCCGGSKRDACDARGYEDAYHQFIEPVVAASGERIETVQS